VGNRDQTKPSRNPSPRSLFRLVSPLFSPKVQREARQNKTGVATITKFSAPNFHTPIALRKLAFFDSTSLWENKRRESRNEIILIPSSTFHDGKKSAPSDQCPRSRACATPSPPPRTPPAGDPPTDGTSGARRAQQPDSELPTHARTSTAASTHASQIPREEYELLETRTRYPAFLRAIFLQGKPPARELTLRKASTQTQ